MFSFYIYLYSVESVGNRGGGGASMFNKNRSFCYNPYWYGNQLNVLMCYDIIQLINLMVYLFIFVVLLVLCVSNCHVYIIVFFNFLRVLFSSVFFHKILLIKLYTNYRTRV